jgi:hypothetical protein
LKKAARQEEKAPEHKPLISSDFIQGLLQSYNYLSRLGNSFISEYREIKEFLPPECKDLFKLEVTDKYIYYDETFVETAKNRYVQRLRRIFWEKLFANKEWQAKLTSNLVDELHGKINELMNYEFSEWNIMRLWLEVMSNLSVSMENTILKLFDTLSHEHHYTEYSGNIHYYNGWKTNKCWKVNHKIIIPIYAFYARYDKKVTPRYYTVSEKLGDIEKVFDVLNGEPANFPALHTILGNAETAGKTCNIETRYFFITFYKKGTAHITFKDMALLKKFNIFASQRKNWLPPTYGKKHYADMSSDEQSVIDNFEGAISYEGTLSNKDFYLVENKQSLLMLERAG